MARVCGDCGREKREPEVPAFASAELKAVLETSAWQVCMWCHDVNLLSGGFVIPGLEERYDEVELVQLHRAADDKRATKQMHILARRHERERKRMEREMDQKGLLGVEAA